MSNFGRLSKLKALKVSALLLFISHCLSACCLLTRLAFNLKWIRNLIFFKSLIFFRLIFCNVRDYPTSTLTFIFFSHHMVFSHRRSIQQVSVCTLTFECVHNISAAVLLSISCRLSIGMQTTTAHLKVYQVQCESTHMCRVCKSYEEISREKIRQEIRQCRYTLLLIVCPKREEWTSALRFGLYGLYGITDRQ